uniref:HSF-type DNA-binding domain-containing protein n=1 Tax=Clastoptera arizonana TaxID=38151 RepID=A0A1B6D4L1_9HEMI
MHSISEIGTNVPAFLGKLWNMVEDPVTNELISWCSEGDSFVIKDATRLAKELLPKYYKHNNMASFIRQLNMYGFHKIISTNCKQEIEELKFSHPNFLCGHPYLLENIKRKMTASVRQPDKPNIMNKMLNDVRQMKGKQDSLDNKLAAMKRENEALWRELSVMRKKHQKQQHIVNKLIQYLVMLIQSNHLPVNRRGFPLMLKDKTIDLSMEDNTKSPTGPIILELDTADVFQDMDSSTEVTTSSLTNDESTHFVSADDFSNKILTLDSIETENSHTKLDNDQISHTLTKIPVELQNIASLTVDNSEYILGNNNSQVIMNVEPNNRKRITKSSKLPTSKKRKVVNKPQTAIAPKNTKNNTIVLVPENYLPSTNVQSPSNVDIVLNGDAIQASSSVTPAVVQPILLFSPDIIQQSSSPSPIAVHPTPLPSPIVVHPTPSPSPIVVHPAPSPPVLIQPTSLLESNVIQPSTDQKSSETVIEDWTSPGPLSPSKDTFIGNTLVESLFSSIVAETDPLSAESSGTSEGVSRSSNNNMQVACKSGSALNRDEMDQHLESLQFDLDSFKELLKNENISMDANALLGFLNEDSENCDSSLNNFSKQKEVEGNELIMYNAPIFDLNDMIGENDWNLYPNEENQSLEDDVYSDVLNTPIVVPKSPSFPSAAKAKTK